MPKQVVANTREDKSRMHVVLVTNDLVRLSFLICLLRDAGVEALVLDHQVSTLEGA